MSDDLVYLDYAASTPVDARVSALMAEIMTHEFANPSSTHAAGRVATARIEAATEQLAGLLNTAPTKLVWTSGATESDNLAIMGAARFRDNKGRHLISMRTEHKAVTDALDALSTQGFEVTWLQPDASGVLARETLEAAIRDDTQLVSIMHVNNETGAVQDIESLGEACRERDVLFHVDAAQSVGKLPIDLDRLPVDMLSMTAHKVYGPKGIGALYVDERPGCHVLPMLFGGGQQRRLRPGTMPAPLIAAFGLAAEIAADRMTDDHAHLRRLRQRLWQGIKDIDGVSPNGDLDNTFPGILNVSVAGIEGESLLLALEPVCVATGSACNSQNQEPSYVLRALGRSDTLAQSAIRFSMGRPSSDQDIDLAIQKYTAAVAKLRRIAPGQAA
ncbi:MAG: aminotransferase class V-fold PLP-dependent enzyme [Woeseiaceae bacterium]